jgi:carbonic anhydrase/acetyltransferase-like protein (isoleucine patch superfamily)
MICVTSTPGTWGGHHVATHAHDPGGGGNERVLDADLGDCARDGAGCIRWRPRLSLILRAFCLQPGIRLRATERSDRGRASLLSGKPPMAVFQLDKAVPDLPADGRYWIAENAAVIGRVRLKTDTSVWFGSVLRGDNEWIELGERSQIQDNATLHTDPGFPIIIGEDCVIGHNVVLHGCRIGSNSLVGMGAILLNGSVIGRSSLVGAGALVTERKVFPERSLVVGSPARAVRSLDDAALAGLERSARHYVENGRRFRAGLTPL